MVSIPKQSVLLTNKERARQAEFKIGELERQHKWLSNRVAYLMVGIQALGKKLNYSPDEAKECINQFIIEREMEETEKLKEQLKSDIAAGKTPSFKIVDETKKGE